jgi:hypothetical protein
MVGSRRRVTAGAVALVSVAALAAGCGTPASDAAARQVPGSVVRDAAQRTGEVNSGRTVVSTRFTGFDGALAPSDDAEVVVEGAFDVAAGKATLSVDLAQVADALGGGLGRVGAALLPGVFSEPTTAVVDATTVYLRSPVLQLVGAPTPWVSESLETSGGTAAAGGFADPLGLDELDRGRSFVAYLEGVADQVREEGPDEIAGEPVTRYTGTVELDRAVDRLPVEDQAEARAKLDAATVRQVPFVVWVDGQGLVRRVQLTLDGVTLGGGADGLGRGSVEVTADLVGANEPVAIEVPPTDQVTPASSLGGAGGLDGSPLLPGWRD